MDKKAKLYYFINNKSNETSPKKWTIKDKNIFEKCMKCI